MFCGECGTQINEGVAFCPTCGRATNATAATDATPVNVTPEQPVYTAPEQPAYTAPEQPVYTAPEQPAYTAPEQPVYTAPEQPVYAAPTATPANGNKGLGIAAISCGISSLVISVLGSILFGAPAALIALALGIVAVVLGINVKKQGGKGSGSVVCGIIGIALGAFFAIGCAACGACSGSYGCYGCVGSSCKAKSDIDRLTDDFGDFNDLMNDLYDYY